MKMQPDRFEGANAITRFDGRTLMVNQQAYRASVLVPSSGPVVAWEPVRLADLRAEHIEAIAALAPELVILGTGSAHGFPDPEVCLPLLTRGIGVESMATAAACRTYNVLAAEGRRVLAALLIEDN